MVDTESHEIFPMSPVSEGLPLGKVARGFSGGGGIYVGEALRTGEEARSSRATRPRGTCCSSRTRRTPRSRTTTRRPSPRCASENVTVSVIGLGTPKDSDAKLLQEVAALGGGRIYFAEDAMSLPRIFSQETIPVARASLRGRAHLAWRRRRTCRCSGSCRRRGCRRRAATTSRTCKPRANVALRTLDENAAPLLACGRVGPGASVAFMARGGRPVHRRAAPVERRCARRWRAWCAGPSPAAAAEGEAVARAERQRQRLRVTLDFAPGEPLPAALPTLVLLPGDGEPAPVELPMRWEDEDRLAAEFTLPGRGTWHPVVKLGDAGPARAAGDAALCAGVRAGQPEGGAGRCCARWRRWAAAWSGSSMAGLFTEAPVSEGRVALAPWLVGFAVVVLLAEVVVRRFFSTPRLRKPAPRRGSGRWRLPREWRRGPSPRARRLGAWRSGERLLPRSPLPRKARSLRRRACGQRRLSAGRLSRPLAQAPVGR